jgi:hypothetical protein
MNTLTAGALALWMQAELTGCELRVERCRHAILEGAATHVSRAA